MKKIIILLLTINILYAGMLEEKIKNIIGEKNYMVHKNLIDNSFKNKELFVQNDNINYLKVLEVLKSEGLLDLQLKSPSNIHIDFEFIGNKFHSLKNVKDIMVALGYNYFKAYEINDHNDTYIYSIDYRSEFLLDSQMFANELNQIDAKIIDIESNENNKWYYKIDFSGAKVYGAKKMTNNEKIKLKKPLKPYLLEIEDAKTLVIISPRLNKWYPKIAFLDERLEYINSVEKDRVYKGVRTKIPNATKYIQVGDSYSLMNIKRGLTIIVKN